MFLSVIGQFAIHLSSLMFVVDLAKSASTEYASEIQIYLKVLSLSLYFMYIDISLCQIDPLCPFRFSALSSLDNHTLFFLIYLFFSQSFTHYYNNTVCVFITLPLSSLTHSLSTAGKSPTLPLSLTS